MAPARRTTTATGTTSTDNPVMATSNAQSSSSSLSARIVSGSVGSLITALAVTPLEVAKVHLQSTASSTASSTPQVPKNVSLCPKGCGTFVLNNGLFDCVLPKCSVPYFDQFGNLKCMDPPTAPRVPPRPTTKSSNGTFAVIRKIFVAEGLQGIYAGLGPTLVMGIPSTAFYYTVYDELVHMARSSQGSQAATYDAYVPLLAGSSARLLSTLLTAPLELVRTRQASLVGEGRAPPGMWTEFQTIVRQQGYPALYKGLAPTLWRDVPFSGIYWLCLEQFRPFFITPESSTTATPLQQAGASFLSGASAGMVAAACTTPFDVVKTRQQAVQETIQSVVRTAEVAATSTVGESGCDHCGLVQYTSSNSSTPQSRQGSVFHYMKSIYQQEGIQGLWRGNQTRMIKVAPSCAIMITCYELGKQMLAEN